MSVWAIFAGLAGVIHIAFFVLESFLFTKPAGRKIFKMSEADAETMKFFAFNQGFYNRSLAIGVLAGIAPGQRAGSARLGHMTSIAIPGVPPGVYYVRVKALNEVGPSPASADVRVVVP